MSKIIFCWSSGKDSAMALHTIMQDPNYEVVGLLTTVTEEYDRVSMHGIRRNLVERQAEAIGLPLITVTIPPDCNQALYEERMRAALMQLRDEGVVGAAFGDLFLEDLRNYRQEKMAVVGMDAVFPIWTRDTVALAQRFQDDGFAAVVTCVDTQVMDASFAGRRYDAEFLRDLPSNVDPCGENGEFHSFVYGGPIFKHALPIRIGERVLRDQRFSFCDVMLA